MTYNTLVLSGGAIRGFSHLGALHYFSTNNLLNDIKTYVGTSVGSMICYLLIIGYKPIEIFNYIHNIDFTKLIPNNGLDVPRLIKEFGLSSIDGLLNEIEKLTIQKLEFVPSLEELYEHTGKDLIITTYNLTKQQIEYKSRHTDKDLSCLDAIKLSSSIPIIFDKCIYDKCIYIDGGLVDNFPIEWADKYINEDIDKIILNWDTKILGINIKYEEKDQDTTNLINYLIAILSISHKVNKKKAKEYSSHNTDIYNLPPLKEGNITELTVQADNQSLLKMFSEANSYIEEVFQSRYDSSSSSVSSSSSSS